MTKPQDASSFKTPENILASVRAHCALNGVLINARRRDRAAKGRKRDREHKWTLCQQNPPSKTLPAHEQFQFWWKAQPRFSSLLEFAVAVGATTRTISDWLAGKYLPDSKYRKAVYETTLLSVFASEYYLPEQLTRLRDRANNYVDTLPAARNTIKQYREYIRRIVAQFDPSEVEPLELITPQLVIQKAAGYKSRKVERVALSLFGRFLRAEDLWNDMQQGEFENTLKTRYPQIFRRSQRTEQKTPARPLDPEVAFLSHLATGVGLATRQIRNLRAKDIGDNGIEIGRGQLIRFGNGVHEIPEDIVQRYLTQSKPTDYLFFCRRPPDYHRPISRKRIVRALRQAGFNTRRSQGAQMAHFISDYVQINDPKKLRAHFQAFHGLSQGRSRELAIALAKLSSGILLPKPQQIAEMIRRNSVKSTKATPSQDLASRPKRLTGAPRKQKPNHISFGEEVDGTLPRFGKGLRALVKAKKDHPANPHAWTGCLRSDYSEREISALLSSRTAKAAAIRCASERRKISVKTGKNFYSLFVGARRDV